ncbi:MAG: biotin/lipoyl-binding protein [Ardenticatenaceae bacterium]|nr:biotin/lipoyl-binding protein [Ardenticatenaceae bacterium]
MNKLLVTIEEQLFEVALDVMHWNGTAVTVLVDGVPLSVQVPPPNHSVANIDWMIVNGRPYEIVFDEQLRWIKTYSGLHNLEVRDLEAAVARPRSRDGRVKAPIPGLVTQVLVQAGETVMAGQPLLVLEAMKMENEIRSPRGGVVTAVHVSTNQSVLRDEVLAEIG